MSGRGTLAFQGMARTLSTLGSGKGPLGPQSWQESPRLSGLARAPLGSQAWQRPSRLLGIARTLSAFGSNKCPLGTRVWQGPSWLSRFEKGPLGPPGLARALLTLGSGMPSCRLSGLPKTLSALGSRRDPLALGSCRGLSLLLMSGKGPPGSQFWQNLLGSQGLTRARSALGSGKGSSRLSGLARAIGPNHAVFSHNQFKESSAASFSYSNSICFDCRLRLGVGCRSRRRSTKETVTPSDGFWRHFDRGISFLGRGYLCYALCF